ncbi:MAG: alkaline phosphatase family protein [Actinomycetes bacterium]
MEPPRPDPSAPDLARLVPALGEDRPAWLPEPARGASRTVLLVLDGLGYDQLDANRSVAPHLAAMDGGWISSVVPSTTSAALTSIVTGRHPVEHGVLGYRVREGDDVLNVLQWRMEGGGRAPDPSAYQRYPAFGGRTVPVVTQSSFRNSGFTRAHLADVDFAGWSTVALLVEQCVRAVRAGAPLVYAYYPGVDTVAHEFGLADDRYRAEVGFADRLVGWLLDALPVDCALLVTADHGQVEVGPSGWVEVGELAPFVALQAGDGRFRYLHAREGRAADLAGAAREVVGERAWVLTRRELLDGGWFGPGRPTPAAGARIGDVVLAARDHWAFIDPALRREAGLVGAHGSLTPGEMRVPLLGARGRAPAA